MPQFIKPTPYGQDPAPNRIRWTRTQCDAIREAGILIDRYELVDGEVISKMGQKPSHRLAVVLLNAWLTSIFGALTVQTQATIDVGSADPDHNEPESDAAVTREPSTAYAHRHPGPEDLHLVVEVSDTTLRFERTVKANLYARAGISEYWIVHLVERQIFVHRQPTQQGYVEIAIYDADETIAPLVLPTATVVVSDLLPPVV